MDKNYVKEVREIIEQELVFTCADNADNQWLFALSTRINDLILNNFNKLILLLYRLDINEPKLMKLLKDAPGSDAGTIIGKLIVERQLQKVKTRETFGKKDININDNEKW